MHFILMLVFLFIWLLILWFGSIALQRTGMERGKARFQALSALTSSGFTTSESENVVNNSARRSIVSWLMFIGNAGAMLFVIAIILYARAAIVTPSFLEAAIIIVSLLAIFLVLRFGLLDIIGDVLAGSRKDKGATIENAEILLQAGDHAVIRLKAAEKSCLPLDGLTILAIERDGQVIQQPGQDAAVQPGDRLLCYGRLTSINSSLL